MEELSLSGFKHYSERGRSPLNGSLYYSERGRSLLSGFKHYSKRGPFQLNGSMVSPARPRSHSLGVALLHGMSISHLQQTESLHVMFYYLSDGRGSLHPVASSVLSGVAKIQTVCSLSGTLSQTFRFPCSLRGPLSHNVC